METKKQIEEFLKKANWAAVLSCVLKALVLTVPMVLLFILFLSGFDRALQLPSWGRKIFWVGGFVTIVAVFGKTFFPLAKFSLKEKSLQLYTNAKGNKTLFRPDDFRLAVELLEQKESAGLSEGLRIRFLNEFSDKIKSCSVWWCFHRWDWLRGIMVMLLISSVCGSLWAFFPARFPVGNHILFPFSGGGLSRVINVLPGDAEVPWGESIDIKVALKVSSIHRPELYVKAGKDWISVESVKNTQGVQTFLIEKIVENLEYRIKWKRDWSRRYEIRPLKPITIRAFDISLTQPDYIGGEKQAQSSPELVGLAGTGVRLSVETNANLIEAKVLFDDESEKSMAIESGKSAKASFSLFKSGTYGLYLVASDGRIMTGRESYSIQILEDLPPELTLLSPEEDLIVGENETIPLTYDARDDFGVKDISLVWIKTSGKVKEKRIKQFGQAQESILDSYDWDLGAENFRPGEVFRYKLRARDGNIVTGPGQTETDWRVIEVASFDQTHESIEKELEKWQDELLDLLADVNTTRAKGDDPNTSLDQLKAEFNKEAGQSKKLEKALDKLVSAMEQDPLADYEMWLEHEAIADNLEALNQSTVKNIQSSLQTKNKPAAMKGMDELAAELERMSALSEDLLKSQRARDVMDSGEKLAELGKDLADQMEMAAKDPSKNQDLIDQINKTMAEAMDLMKKMAEQIQKFPDELPEDFVNQQALKEMDINQAADLLLQISQAMQAGDFKKAAKLAQQFLDQAKKMSSQISEAHESFSRENSASEMESEISEKHQKLKDITEAQRKILSGTQKLETQRLRKLLAEQDKLLAKLAAKQEKILNDTDGILRNETINPYTNTILFTQKRMMLGVLTEFTEKRLDKSKGWLDIIISDLGSLNSTLKNSSAPVSLQGKIESLIEGEKEILEYLIQELAPSNDLSSTDKEQFSKLSQEQKGLSGQTEELKKDLQRLSRKTASIGVPISEALSKAAGEMTNAASGLESQDSKRAQSREERALKYLQDADQALQDAQDAMQQMSQKGGGKGGSSNSRVMKRGQMKGSKGSKTGKVLLPKAEDYKPPKEFREELLESLKEKYPDSYKDIIHKYFKRLSE